jgi:hypothetical protein
VLKVFRPLGRLDYRRNLFELSSLSLFSGRRFHLSRDAWGVSLVVEVGVLHRISRRFQSSSRRVSEIRMLACNPRK